MSQKEEKKQTEEQTQQETKINVMPAIERKLGRLTIELEIAYSQLDDMHTKLTQVEEENKKLKEMINSGNQVNAKKQ